MYVSANEKAVSLNLHRYTKVLTLMDIMREFPAFIMGFLACAVGLALFTLSFC